MQAVNARPAIHRRQESQAMLARVTLGFHSVRLRCAGPADEPQVLRARAQRLLRMLDWHAAIVGRDGLLLAWRHAELNASADFGRQRIGQSLVDAVRDFAHCRADDGNRRGILRRYFRIVQIASRIGYAGASVQRPFVDAGRGNW